MGRLSLRSVPLRLRLERLRRLRWVRRLLLVLGTLPRLLTARSNFSVGCNRSGRVTLDPAIPMLLSGGGVRPSADDEVSGPRIDNRRRAG